jgi:hypoxanthine phosphoribosyltransferase
MTMDESKIDVLIDEDLLAEKIARLGETITNDYREAQEIHLVCILKGSILFCADLMRTIKCPLEVHFVTLSSYGDVQTSSGNVSIQSAIPEAIRGKHVIVVEDIVDTGLTLHTFLTLLKNNYGLASLEVAALLVKPSKAIHHIPVKYLGFSIDDKFVIGYGLDLAQKYRNLPYVGVFRG